MANDPKWTAATARADKLLEPDGSVKTLAGTVVSGPSAAGAAMYTAATARADKLLEPDGSITTSGTGGSAGVTQIIAGTNVTVVPSGGTGNVTVNATSTPTPPGGSTTQLQYNNAGAFGGMLFTTDGATFIKFPNNGWLGDGTGSTTFQIGGGQILQVAATAYSWKISTNYIMYINSIGVGIGPGAAAPVNAANSASLDIGNATNASPGINRSSGQLNITGNFYTGSASAQDWWSIQNVFTGSGNNPPATLTINHNGTNPGVAQVAFNTPVKTGVYTVATLPAASAALQGARALVTDATSPTFLGALTGGGSVVCPVFCTGAAWLAG